MKCTADGASRGRGKAIAMQCTADGASRGCGKVGRCLSLVLVVVLARQSR